MGRYFDYSDWDIEELCNHIRERIYESKKPIPGKVMKHYVSIVYKVGEGCYQYSGYGWFSYGNIPQFKTREEAEEYLDSIAWLTRTGDNSWIEEGRVRHYDTSDGKTERCHYEIRESDYEEYEDGEDHIEYTSDEKRYLSEILYNIEKARCCMDVYDHCCDQGSFGGGSFVKEFEEKISNFNKTYTEELPEDWFNRDDD